MEKKKKASKEREITLFFKDPGWFEGFIRANPIQNACLEEYLIRNDRLPDDWISDYWVFTENLPLLIQKKGAKKVLELYTRTPGALKDLPLFKQFLELYDTKFLSREFVDGIKEGKEQETWKFFLLSPHVYHYIKNGGTLEVKDLKYLLEMRKFDVLQKYEER